LGRRIFTIPTSVTARGKIGKDQCLLRKLNGPDSCASTDVQYALRILADWCKEKISSQKKAIDVMKKINPVLFLFIIWLRTDSVTFLTNGLTELKIPENRPLHDMHGNDAHSKK